MKKLLSAIILVSVLSGCTTKTQFGHCIGVLDEEKPNLVYKIDWWNAFLGVIFVETIVVPAIVVFDNIKCPIDVDNAPAKIEPSDDKL